MLSVDVLFDLARVRATDVKDVKERGAATWESRIGLVAIERVVHTGGQMNQVLLAITRTQLWIMKTWEL